MSFKKAYFLPKWWTWQTYRSYIPCGKELYWSIQDPAYQKKIKREKKQGKLRNRYLRNLTNNLSRRKRIRIWLHITKKPIRRVYPWIKILELFYSNQCCKFDKYIIWIDDPKVWEDSSDNANSILIDIRDKTCTLFFYRLTFITTGTIMIQGNKYMLFVEKHFSILKSF